MSTENRPRRAAKRAGPPREDAVALLVAGRGVTVAGDADVAADCCDDALRVRSPTDEELRELIHSVDDDGDCRIQLREFIKLFALGLDTEGEAKQSDVTDIYYALGGNPRDENDHISGEGVESMLADTFGLEVRLGDVFGVSGEDGAISRADVDRMIIGTPRADPK